MSIYRSILLLLLYLTLPNTHTQSTYTPEYISSDCVNTTFPTNSLYKANLNTLLTSLNSKATSYPASFFGTVNIGDGTHDAVYGLYLCRGDINDTACARCVTFAVKDITKTYCPNSKAGVVWYDECIVRFSNETLLGKMSDTPYEVLINTESYKGNITLYKDTMEYMMSTLSSQTAIYYTEKKFTTKMMSITGSSDTLYAMEQCTPDLSASDCARCLQIANSRLEIKRGSRVLQPSCFVRYESYPFYPGAVNYTADGNTNSKRQPQPKNKSHSKRKLSPILIVVLLLAAVIPILMLLGWLIYSKRMKGMERFHVEIDEMKRFVESLQFDLTTVRSATRNFAADNKLGEGGFGEVYKGILEGGQKIAVKRLSKNSGQGLAEFKTEIILVAKLQHKNLVKLLGYCAAPKESLLIYEFLPNSSLDRFLSDRTKRACLDWQTRHKIIIGIARGLLYLHEDSRIKVVHRDLKASNILLDEAMNPKIADFGLARLFEVDQTQDDTKRIVGTYGYMAPEYAITGQYSVKSDVYSFGVMVLEIVSGQRIRYGRLQLEEALLHRAWRLWNENTILSLVDPEICDNYVREQVQKCIQVGLLSVQENAVDRPRMTSIVAALNGEVVDIPEPKPPHFFGHTNNADADQTVVQNVIELVYSGIENITDIHSRD